MNGIGWIDLETEIRYIIEYFDRMSDNLYNEMFFPEEAEDLGNVMHCRPLPTSNTINKTADFSAVSGIQSPIADNVLKGSLFPMTILLYYISGKNSAF